MVPTAAQLMLHRHMQGSPQPPVMPEGSQQQQPSQKHPPSGSEFRAAVQKWFSEWSSKSTVLQAGKPLKTASCKTPEKSIPDVIELCNC